MAESAAGMGFIGEAIEADTGTMEPSVLARGEPNAPRAFTWRDARYEVVEVTRTWKSYKTDRGEKYVDRHWFEVVATTGEVMRLYLDRRPKKSKRWWLFSVGDLPAPPETRAPKDTLERYLDETGRVTSYPARLATRRLVLAYLATKFETRRTYDELGVNEVLKAHHTFADWALLRRELFDNGFLNRTANGRTYWR